ncbi:MAG: HAD family hydrolase [Bryobacter sp.]
MRPNRQFPVYLFDLDGTLWDSAPDICGALASLLASQGRHDIPFDYLRSFIGRHLADLFAELDPVATQEQIQEWIQAYRKIYISRGHSQTTLYPEVAATIPRLLGRKATATTKSTETAATILQQFGLHSHFQHVQGTDGFPSKPNPEVILRAIYALGAQPEECLFVGDSVPDMIAGKAAGVNVCAVSYGYGVTEELLACEPDFLIHRFDELDAH